MGVVRLIPRREAQYEAGESAAWTPPGCPPDLRCGGSTQPPPRGH